jgi:hypothetical protein
MSKVIIKNDDFEQDETELGFEKIKVKSKAEQKTSKKNNFRYARNKKNEERYA